MSCMYQETFARLSLYSSEPENESQVGHTSETMPRMPVEPSPAYFPEVSASAVVFGGSELPSAADGTPSVMSTTLLAWQEKQIESWFEVPSDSLVELSQLWPNQGRVGVW